MGSLQGMASNMAWTFAQVPTVVCFLVGHWLKQAVENTGSVF